MADDPRLLDPEEEDDDEDDDDDDDEDGRRIIVIFEAEAIARENEGMGGEAAGIER